MLAKCVKQRRQGLIGAIMPMFAPDFVFPPAGAMVWMENSKLRRILACTDNLEDTVCSSISPFGSNGIHCSHSSTTVSPMDAHCGKLLPRKVIDSIFEVLLKEQSDLGKDCLGSWCSTNGYVVASLYCKSCAELYTAALLSNMVVCRDLVLVSEAFDCKDLLDVSGSNDALTSSKRLYLVSRKFVTRFRNMLHKFIRQTLGKPESILHGMYAFRGSDLFEHSHDVADSDALDPTVNGCITCKWHGSIWLGTACHCLAMA
jgi:hypothetical protein